MLNDHTVRTIRLRGTVQPLPFAWSLALFAVGMLASPVNAVERSCGPDAVANTATVLCAPPSGPCTATTVTVSEHLEIPDGSHCGFDLGGRNLVVKRTIEVAGSGPGIEGAIDVFNAGRVEITRTGKLKARGDFIRPFGYIVGGGRIALESAAALVVHGVLDVTGDSAGEIDLRAHDDLQIAATAHVRGNGASSFLDEGERSAEGALVEMRSLAGSIRIDGKVMLNGQGFGTGGDLTLVAARDIVITHRLTLVGGEGGQFQAIAGDDVVLTRAINIESTGGDFGGDISLEAGADLDHDAVPAGNVRLDGVTITMRGGSYDEFGGDGGELDIESTGNITLRDVVIRADADPRFDGSGGNVILYTGSPPGKPAAGDIEIEGTISVRGGRDDGDGGEVIAYSNWGLIVRADIDASAPNAGTIELESKGPQVTHGRLRTESAQGHGGSIWLLSGSKLRVGAHLLGAAGPEGPTQVRLQACALTLEPGIKIDGSAGPYSWTSFISNAPMNLGAGSRYVSAPDPVELHYPPGGDPIIGDDVTFDAGWIGGPLPESFPGCPAPNCGNGVRESGEDCDDGNLHDGDGCSRLCKMQCTQAPTLICTTPAQAAQATLELRDDNNDSRDRVIWRWLKGGATTSADFGDPTTTDHYALCLYSSEWRRLLVEAVALAGGLCDGRPCWTATARGFAYDNPKRTSAGIATIQLETGADGEAKIVTAARGVHAPLPERFPLRLPVLAQLQSSHGPCWEATYSAAEKNDDTRFEALAD